MNRYRQLGLIILICATLISPVLAAAQTKDLVSSPLELIRPSTDGTHFIGATSGRRFIVWGFNYDRDDDHQLIENYWEKEWDTVVGDFREMKALGANVVRIHLQTGKFMDGPRQPNTNALRQLGRMVELAAKTGLYLDVTGLGCYRKQDIPAWYSAMNEAERWNVQALFWESVAGICAKSPAIFCYDLMNEPIVGSDNSNQTEWVTGELGGLSFVQRISLDLAGRTRDEVVRTWIDKLVGAIRKVDRSHMITVGEIPWATVFVGATSTFHSKTVGTNLDFVSVHFYPKRGEIDKALKALAAYEIGKPLVIEETFTLECGVEDLERFIEGSRPIADGWIGFYWGKTVEDYSREKPTIGGAIAQEWLKYFSSKGPKIMNFPSEISPRRFAP